MKNSNLPIILLATFFGILAGVAGSILTSVYQGYSSPLGFGNELNLSNYGYLSPGLVIRDPKKVVVSQDVKVTESISNLQPSLVSIFKEEKGSDSYYDLNSPFAKALVATTDGWVMAAWPEQRTKPDATEIAKDYLAIDSNSHHYKIDKIVSSKLTGSFIFLHLEGASGLAVRRLLPQSEIEDGQSLLVSADLNQFFQDNLSVKVSSALISSDNYFRELSLASGRDFKPAFVFNLSGDILGVIDDQGSFIASPELDAYWRSLLKSGEISRPIIGLNYLDLSSVYASSTLPSKGALLKASAKEAAVIKNGPAAKAGLKAGDIITRVNGEEINGDNELADLVLQADSGDSWLLEYSRKDKNNSLELTVGSKQ